MGMSTHIVGFKPPDEKWKKMKAIYDACSAGDVELPDEVDDFFGGETPDPAGVTVDLEDLDAVEDYSSNAAAMAQRASRST